MSCVGSTLSVCSSITNPQTLLQGCSYLKEHLGLSAYRADRGPTPQYYVKISSKSLRECFVLPDDGTSVEDVLARLGELMCRLKEKNSKPPRTDFTCLCRQRRVKVCVDIDCIKCKNGELPPGKRHFSSTLLFNTLLKTVGQVFGVNVSEGIYLTNGGQTCGYHVFFNTLAYGRNGITEAALMDALDVAFKRAKLNNVAVDRGCTQMPLPTSMHSNSPNYSIPYVLVVADGVTRNRLNWTDMDADTLKCFSCIAFPDRYKDEVYGRDELSSSSTPPVRSLSPREGTPVPLVQSLKLNKRKIRSTTPPPQLSSPQPWADGASAPKRKCLSQVDFCVKRNVRHETEKNTFDLGGRKGRSATEDELVAEGDESEEEKCRERVLSGFGPYVSTAPAPKTPSTTQVDRLSQVSVPPTPEEVIGGRDTPPQDESDDVASTMSTYTDCAGAASFVCLGVAPSHARSDVGVDDDSVHMPPPPPPPPIWDGKRNEKRQQQQRSIRAHDDEEEEEEESLAPDSIPLTNTIECLPYMCQDDRTSVFADKRYKAALLCAEESEAAESMARLDQENRNNGRARRRVYIVAGSSANVAREYKLLVQLVNVNRCVYGCDLSTRREWTDLLVSYYDQHLRNPILLVICKFVLGEKGVAALFRRAELKGVIRSVIYLMAPFKQRRGEENDGTVSDGRLVDDGAENEEQMEREARPHKARLVGALIRVCTHLFGMVTAVVSDLRKVQQAKERKDLTLLNCTVVDERSSGVPDTNGEFGRAAAPNRSSSRDPVSFVDDDVNNASSDEDLDCSASMRDGGGGIRIPETARVPRCATNYTLLASLVVHEHANLSDQSLYAYLYYYHSFPSIAVDRILDEVHHEGLIVSSIIKYFQMHDHRGKPLTLQEIFDGFNDAAIALSGPEFFIRLKRRKSHRRGAADSKDSGGGSGGGDARKKRHDGAQGKRRNNGEAGRVGSSRVAPSRDGHEEADAATTNTDVTGEEIEKLMGGVERKRRRAMCNYNTNGGTAGTDRYEWKDKHLWQAVINYYLRPVAMHEDRLVFANDSYDTFEDDAVESCVAHLMTKSKIAKADVMTAFKDARTVWRMYHGSHLVYESDLRSDALGCCFHINAALKMYEMLCGGCLTRMKRVHKNYLIDRTRFNMSVYDVVAECRTATVRLTSAIDRSYVNLLLKQPVVPPFLEDDADTRRLFLADTEIRRGSFCCLSVMDYIRALNLFERSNCTAKTELDNCDYVERFLDDMYTNDIAVGNPPNAAAAAKVRLVYLFYSLYMYEVLFNMRHAYARRENCYVSIERLAYELDVRELLVLFFGESGMKRVEGLDEETERRICQTADCCGANKNAAAANATGDLADGNTAADGRFDVRPVLSADVPDKVARMKTLFGQFGFDVMHERTDATTFEEGGSGVSVETPPENETTAVDRGANGNACGSNSCTSGGDSQKNWDDECRFEQEFYAADDWLDTVYERITNRRIAGRTPKLIPGGNTRGGERMFLRETVRTIMRLELKRHVDNDRVGKLSEALRTSDPRKCRNVLAALKELPLRLKLLALILTTHTVKGKSDRLASDFVDTTYRCADGRFEDERRVYEGDVNSETGTEAVRQKERGGEPAEKVWCRAWKALLKDRRSLLLHARWLAESRFDRNFFVGLEPEKMYNVLYEYMSDHADVYPSFRRYNENAVTRPAAQNLCTAVMYVLVMSAYDQEHVDLYLKTFLAVEWPGQWAKSIFVWKSNSNAGKSYLFDSIIKRACANSTCINDPKGGKENAPEKAEYVRNFVLFANEFSQANSNELKKIVSESTFKFRMNYGNVMNEVYATGKIMFNCNTLPPTSDEAAINRLTLFSIPFWFCRRQRISDAMLNWVRGLSPATRTRWETAYRYELPALLTEEEKRFFEKHRDTKNETDLFDGYAALRPQQLSFEFNAATSSLFLAQNKISRLYVASSPPTDRIVHGLVNITAHFSWLRHFKGLDAPVDFSTLPAASQAVRSEWLSLTLPYQEWKSLTGARTDPTGRVPAESVNRSLQVFAAKKNVNYFGIRQFFESDFASSREAIRDEYYMWFDAKAVCE